MNTENNDMDKSENKEELAKFIEQETAANLKKADKVWKIGAFLVVFVACYMTWIVTSVSSFLNPTELGASVAGNIDSSIPSYLAQAEEYLMSQAPILANDASEQAFDLVKNVKSQGEDGMEHSMNMLIALRGELDKTITNHFETHGDEIKELYAEHQNQDISKLVVHDLMNEMGQSADAMLRSTDDAEGWPEIKQTSLEALMSINASLEKLAKAPSGSLNKVQQVQKKAIAAWVHALNGEFKDKKVDLIKLTGEG